INVHKSKVLRLGVLDVEVSTMASVIGCGVTKFLLKYLGVPVGCNMSSIKEVSSRTSSHSTWGAILSSINKLKQKDMNCFITNRVPLKDWSYVFRRHPRGGVEASQFVALQSAIRNMVLSNQSDSWQGSPDI
nr:RNA-directed DNA polymerase, eukaryota, reverse transcriptase zinc-binding domain protein [Tanacetum cinerariifolium]